MDLIRERISSNHWGERTVFAREWLDEKEQKVKTSELIEKSARYALIAAYAAVISVALTILSISLDADFIKLLKLK